MNKFSSCRDKPTLVHEKTYNKKYNPNMVVEPTGSPDNKLIF